MQIYQVHLHSLDSLGVVHVVDGGHPIIGTFLIRARFWKNIAQHDRIIENVLYSRRHFALSGKILQFRKPTILSFDRISILCGITAFEQKFDQCKNYTFEMMFAKVPPYLKLSHTELKFRP